jgi:hypothetical protein
MFRSWLRNAQPVGYSFPNLCDFSLAKIRFKQHKNAREIYYHRFYVMSVQMSQSKII